MAKSKSCDAPMPSHRPATRQFENGLADPGAHRRAIGAMKAEGISMQEHRKTSRGAHRVSKR